MKGHCFDEEKMCILCFFNAHKGVIGIPKGPSLLSLILKMSITIYSYYLLSLNYYFRLIAPCLI